MMVRKVYIRSCLLLFFLMGTACASFAQRDLSDSVEQRLKRETSDTARIRHMLRISFFSRHNNIKKSDRFARMALAESKRLNQPFFQGHALVALGNVYMNTGKYDSAEYVLKESLRLYSATDYFERGQALNNLALTYYFMNDYKNALIIADQGFKEAPKGMDTVSLCGLYTTVANIYLVQENYENALEYYNHALELAAKKKNHYLRGVLFNNVASVYADLKDYTKAAEKFLEAIKERELTGDKKGLSASTMNAGMMFKELNRIKEAEEYIKRALALKEEIMDQPGLINCHANLADLYLSEKNFSLARRHLETAENMIDQKTPPGIRITVYTVFESLSVALHNSADAYRYLQLKTHYSDSINEIEKTKEISALQVKFETEKKEEENQLLKQQNEIKQMKIDKSRRNTLMLYAGIFVLALVLGITAWAFLLKNKTNKILAAQNDQINRQNTVLKMLNTQLIESEEKLRTSNSTKEKLLNIISHDINSPLKALGNYQRLMLEHSRNLSREELEATLQKISNNFFPLEHLADNLVHWMSQRRDKIELQYAHLPLKKLLEETAEVCRLQASQKKIEILIACNENAKIYGDENLVKLVLRNLCSNALKFTPENGKVEMCYNEEKAEISISDNGIGMDERTIKNIESGSYSVSHTGTSGEEGTGLGLHLVNSSIKLLGATLVVESKKGNGTTFKIKLPGFKNSPVQ
jgi:signal transduction histidine kinase